MPSYLKLTPYPKFKTLLFNYGLMSTVKILHAQSMIKIMEIICE